MSELGKASGETTRTWKNSIVNAAGLLIAVPMISLSILASNPSIPKLATLEVSIPIVLSAISFAGAIFYAVGSQGNEAAAMSAASAMESFGKMAPDLRKQWNNEKWEKAQKDFNALIDSTLEGLEGSAEKIRWATRLFYAGIVLLIGSLLMLAIGLATMGP